MAKKYNVYLEIQRGGWESEKAKQKTTLHPKSYDGWVNAFDLLKIFGAAWLYEPGLAFGKNPPFAPGGSIFKRITESDYFGVQELYASYLLHKLAKELNFGRSADFATRGQTRYRLRFRYSRAAFCVSIVLRDSLGQRGVQIKGVFDSRRHLTRACARPATRRLSSSCKGISGRVRYCVLCQAKLTLSGSKGLPVFNTP